MGSRHEARLDRLLRLRGETITLLRMANGQVTDQIEILAIVKTLGEQQLIARIDQIRYLVITSQAPLRTAGWHDPGPGRDAVVLRGHRRMVERVNSIRDGDVTVRLELVVVG